MGTTELHHGNILIDAQKELEVAKKDLQDMLYKGFAVSSAVQKIEFAITCIKAKRGVL